MAEPELVRDGVAAMRDAVDLPVTVKHRIGVDRIDSYDFVRDFVGIVAGGGCEVFVVHARSAWLKGLSPKENREIPPLRPEWVYRLKSDFPALTIVLNGGIEDDAAITEHLRHVDGVMVGRRAYKEPWAMAGWDRQFFGSDAAPAISREAVEAAMVAYMLRQQADSAVPWTHISRHLLGLYNGLPGARRWRQAWSDHSLKDDSAERVWRQASAARQSAAAVSPADALPA
jgi:tRNA-dihydrouridine synthase A